MTEPLAIRASSWSDLCDCPSRWEAIHVYDMKLPASVPAHIGTSVHHGTAYYDLGRLARRELTIEDAVHAAVEAFQNPREEIDWRHDDVSKRDALGSTIKATQAYCTELAPKYHYTAVELRPEPLDINIEDQIITITGQMDRTRIVQDTNGGIGVNDVKTGRSRVDTHGQVNTNGDKFQMGVYELLTEHSLKQPVTRAGEILAINTSKNARTGVGRIYDAKSLMLGTNDQPGVIETVGKMVKHGLFPPNPRSRLCSERWCPRWHVCKAHD